jgi:hypothetical protein
VAPQFTANVPCVFLPEYGNRYVATLECEECTIPLGACCDPFGNCTDGLFEDECPDFWFQDQICADITCPTATIFQETAPFLTEVRNTCGAGSFCSLRPSEDHTYEITIPYDGEWVFELCGLAAWDTYLYLGYGFCSSDIALDDDGCGTLQSRITAFLSAGTYFLTLEGFSETGCGDYQLYVYENIIPVGACCDPNQNCTDNTFQATCNTPGYTWYQDQLCADVEPCPEVTYCPICTTIGCADEWISEVTFNTLYNASGCEGAQPCAYNDYTYLSTDLALGGTYTLTVAVLTTGWTEYVNVFIDWNQDDVWDATERYDLGFGVDPIVSQDITVPAGATLGATRMRVICRYAAYNPDACTNYSFGEIEDYSINVVP